jgi:hypothetical protein
MAMLLALGAASAALDALTSLVSPKPPSPAVTGFEQSNAASFDITGSGLSSASIPGQASSSQPGCLSPATMSALLAVQSQSSNAVVATPGQSDALKDLLSLDAEDDGPAGLSPMPSVPRGHRHLRQANAAAGTVSAASASAALAYNAIEQAKRNEALALSASPASPLSLSA